MAPEQIARAWHEVTRARIEALGGDANCPRWEEMKTEYQEAAVRAVLACLANPDARPKKQALGVVHGPNEREDAAMFRAFVLNCADGI